MRRLINTFLYLSIAVLSANASEFDFSYDTGDSATFGIGFDKEETYDIAIKLDNGSLDGFSIKGIRVEIPGGADVGAASAWMSKELNLKRKNGKYVNAPDLFQQEGTIEDGFLNVVFEEPYIITEPVYIGYSFTVSQLNEQTAKPVIVAEGTNADGLYLHSSRTKMKWGEYSSEAGAVSSMSVIIEGEMQRNAAVFQKTDKLYGAADDEVDIAVRIENHGENPVESFSYTYSCAGSSGGGDISLPEPLKAVWGASALVNIKLGKIDTLGDNEVFLTVTKVNGEENSDPAPTMSCGIKIYPFIPENRPLVEEYTGLWCGWCPQGYVAMETMREEYPGRFIGLVYHSGDAMQCNFSFPTSPNGYPAAYINRGQDINAKEIYSLWPLMAADFTNVAIDVDVEWTDDAKSEIRATSKVRFIEDERKADYSVAYALVIDGLSDPTWMQSNYYAPKGGEEPKDHPDMPGELGHKFTHGTDPMLGLTFNDVVLALPKPKGFPGSIPSEITAGDEITHSYIFRLADVVDRQGGQGIIQNPDNLRVVAMVMDNKTGRPLNSNTSVSMSAVSNLNVVVPEAEVLQTLWYDMQGNIVKYPDNGIFIKVEMLSNGLRRTSKEVCLSR